MSAILKFSKKKKKKKKRKLHFSEVNYLKLHKKDPILHVTTTFSLKQGETRTSSEPICETHKLKKPVKLILWAKYLVLIKINYRSAQNFPGGGYKYLHGVRICAFFFFFFFFFWVLFHEIWYRGLWVFIRNEGVQITYIGCIIIASN